MSTKRKNLEQKNEWWLKSGIFSLIWRKIQKNYFKLFMFLYHNLSHIFNMAEEILIPPENHRGRAMDWTFLEAFPTMELLMASCHENGFNKGRFTAGKLFGQPDILQVKYLFLLVAVTLILPLLNSFSWQEAMRSSMVGKAFRNVQSIARPRWFSGGINISSAILKMWLRLWYSNINNLK